MKKIILQINGDFGKNFSGLRNLLIYEELKREFEVSVICRKNYSKFKNNIYEPISFKNLIPKIFSFIKKYIYNNFNSSYYSNLLFDYFSKKYIKDANILITFPPYLKSINKAKKEKIKIIINVNSLDIDYNLKYLKKECEKFNINYKSQIGTDKHNYLVKESYLNSDYYFFQSEFSKKTFIENGFKNKNNMFKVNNTFFKLNKKNNYLNLKKDNKFRILFIGSSMIRKGLYYLIEAFLKLDIENKELIILGDFVSKDEKKKFSKYFQYDSIKFKGYTNPEKYYQLCDIFIFPSLSEGAARVCYEAMSHGMPILATKESGAPINKKYIIKSYNNKDIISKLNEIIKNKELKKISSENFELSKKYNMNNYTKNILNILKKII